MHTMKIYGEWIRTLGTTWS